MITTILRAMRADAVPEKTSGRWAVVKMPVTPRQSDTYLRLHKAGMCPWVPAGQYTYLHCATLETALSRPLGEVVMNDFPDELRKHLQFILRASGKVLVTGLGLGCVVRGLLATGRVESIDLVERSADVLRLCAASVNDPRVRLHHRDAITWSENVHVFASGTAWDFAWHDLWSDPERNEPHLATIHGRIMANLKGKVRRQGAWAMPRWLKRRIPGFVG